MSPEQRREMIVAAALPLVIQHGGAVTTAQVARAAGIGEATIFRAFADKDALLDACVAEALRPDRALASLADIALDQPLPDRLTEAVEALQAHLERMGAVIGALFASGHGRGRDPRLIAPEGGGDPRSATLAAATARASGGTAQGADTGPVQGRIASVDATVAAVAELFAPEAESLRWPAERLAVAFLSLVFSRSRTPVPPGQRLAPGELVDLFLHGALR